MEICKRITYFRTLKGYSVNKLANLSGISQSYLREVELGNKNPTVEILSLLCDTLDISLKDFFDDQTSDKFFTDPLIARIYRLSSKQRNALLHFLETIDPQDDFSQIPND